MSSWEQDSPPQAAERVYENIRVLKGVPAPQVPSVMANLTRSLGVGCVYCHVPGAFEKDDKPAKSRARDMFSMVRWINEKNFEWAGTVTCWTCHRGSAKPETLPK